MTPKIAIEFPSQKALDTYLGEHPNADKSKHTVKDWDKHKPKDSAPKPKSEDSDTTPKGEGSKSPSVTEGFFSKLKSKVHAGVKEAVEGASKKVQSFVTDSKARKEMTSDMVSALKASPKKILDSVTASAKKEVKEIKHAGTAMKKLFEKPPEKWGKEDFKAVYATAVYAAAAVVGAAGGGPLMAAGALGKSFAAHVAAKAMHHVLDTGFTHGEAGHLALEGVHLILASEKEPDYEAALVAHLTSAVGAVLAKGVTDEDMAEVLAGKHEGDDPDWDSMPKPRAGKVKSTKEGSVRSQVIRLAYTNPELRPHLLPLLASREAK